MLKPMFCCQTRECQLTRCRSAPPTAPTTNRLCVRAFLVAKSPCDEQRHSVFIAVWCSHLRTGGHCRLVQPPPHGWSLISRVFVGARACKVHPNELCMQALNSLKHVSCVRCTNRLRNCEMSRDPRLECVWVSLLCSLTVARQLLSARRRHCGELLTSQSSKHIATCFEIQGRRLEIFCVAWARIAIQT